MNITAEMMTAERQALGMKAQAGIRTARARITSAPVNTPPKVVFTPLEELTAVLENEPVTGMELTKDPAKLHMPSAIISWLESTGLPPAAGKDIG